MRNIEASIVSALSESASKRIHVAVGVILDEQGKVLLAKRAVQAHQGGLWEFPGGKVENDESVQAALQREFYEEIGITIEKAKPFTQITYHYPDKSVLLDVWIIEKFTGVPTGMEGQPIRWVSVADLHGYDFPQANKPIITALRLPREMMITGSWRDRHEFEQRLQAALERGVRLVQLRAHQCSPDDYLDLFSSSKKLCDAYAALLIVNMTVVIFSTLAAGGLHLTAKQLKHHNQRPVDKSKMLGVSCHNLEELHKAEQIEADYVTLGPVFKTATHPDVQAMGLDAFSDLVKMTSLPIFGLGGVTLANQENIINKGAFGVAAVGRYWI